MIRNVPNANQSRITVDKVEYDSVGDNNNLFIVYMMRCNVIRMISDRLATKRKKKGITIKEEIETIKKEREDKKNPPKQDVA